MNKYKLLFYLSNDTLDAVKVSKSIHSMTCLETLIKDNTIEAFDDDFDLMIKSIDNKCQNIKALGIDTIELDIECFNKNKKALEKEYVDIISKNDISISIRTVNYTNKMKLEDVNKRLLDKLSTKVNRSKAQVEMLFSLCDGRLDMLFELEEKIKNNHISYCPSTKPEITQILNFPPKKTFNLDDLRREFDIK